MKKRMTEAHIIGKNYFHVFSGVLGIVKVSCTAEQYNALSVRGIPQKKGYKWLCSFAREKLDTPSEWLDKGYYINEKDRYTTLENGILTGYNKLWQKISPAE